MFLGITMGVQPTIDVPPFVIEDLHQRTLRIDHVTRMQGFVSTLWASRSRDNMTVHSQVGLAENRDLSGFMSSACQNPGVRDRIKLTDKFELLPVEEIGLMSVRMRVGDTKVTTHPMRGLYVLVSYALQE